MNNERLVPIIWKSICESKNQTMIEENSLEEHGEVDGSKTKSERDVKKGDSIKVECSYDGDINTKKRINSKVTCESDSDDYKSFDVKVVNKGEEDD